jgi:hypothetical protein
MAKAEKVNVFNNVPLFLRSFPLLGFDFNKLPLVFLLFCLKNILFTRSVGKSSYHCILYAICSRFVLLSLSPGKSAPRSCPVKLLHPPPKVNQ